MRILLFILLLSAFSLNAQIIKIENNKFSFESNTYKIDESFILDDGRKWLSCSIGQDKYILITTFEYEVLLFYSFKDLRWTKYNDYEKSSYKNNSSTGNTRIDSISVDYPHRSK